MQPATRSPRTRWSLSQVGARDLAWMLALGIAYYVAAKISLRIALIEHNITPLWPPTGIALVAFIRFGRRLWPGVAVAAFLVNLPISESALAAAVTAVGNTAAPFVGAWLLERVDFHPEIDRIKDVVAIVVLAALLSMCISATVGAGTLVISGAITERQFVSAWSVWWAGDAMGVLVVAPFLLRLSTLRRLPAAGWSRRAEAVILFGLLAAVCVVAADSRVQLFFLVPPIVGWIAWRFQQSGAAPAALLVSCIATWAAVDARGPFAGKTLFQKMLVLQAFNATVAFTGFFLAALVTERMRSREALERAAEELEGRVHERTLELAEAQEMARIGRWEWNLNTGEVSWSDEMFRIHGSLPGEFEVTFDKATELVREEDRQRIADNVRTALEQARSDVPDIEYQIVRPDGGIRVLLGKGRLFTGEDGRPERMVGVVQDVTEQREYQRQHRIADTLQRALLPQELPRTEGFEFAERYLPAEAGLAAGGDWYDVVPLESGAVSVVIGDVAGHGLEAASVMGQLRMATRAYALEGHGPETVVARADSLLQQIAPGVMVTMLYLLIDAETLDARIVNAGHPPLVVLDPEGARFAGAATAPPMGFNPFPRYVEAVEHLRPASTLLLYTDGLIDRPDLPIDVGMERLRAFLSEHGNLDLDRLCERVLSELVQGELNDDIALLAVRAIPASAEPFRLRIPAVPQELAHVRLALSRWLAASGVAPGSAEDVVLASSEACANAVKHAYGPSHGEVDLEAEVQDGSVIVSVRDFGRWRPGHADDGGRGLGLIDSCMSSVSIERGPEGTEVRMRRALDAGGTG